MLPIIAALGSLLPGVKSILDSVNMSKEERNKIEAELTEKIQETTNKVLELAKAEIEASSRIIEAEAKGESWLQRNHRPIISIGFFIIIFARGFNLVPPLNFGENELTLLSYLVGFVAGYSGLRSTEKGLAKIGDALIKRYTK